MFNKKEKRKPCIICGMTEGGVIINPMTGEYELCYACQGKPKQ